MTIHLAKPEHEIAYQELAALLQRNWNFVSSEELLAIAANMLGKILALQNQQTMTRERGMQIIVANLEMGNKQIIDQIKNKTAGSA